MQLAQIVQRAAQLLPVVDAPAQHQLAVHLNARLGELLQVGQRFTCPLVGHHAHPEFWVGGVHRDVDGGNVHVTDALHLMGAEVGQRDVVAEQKAQPLIVVLKI